MANPKLISRSSAKASGASRYFTGKPCKKGHICERWVSSTHCIECYKERQRKRYWSNPEKYLSEKRERRKSNPEQASEYDRARYRRDIVKRAEAVRRWRSKNLVQSERYIKRWREENKDRVTKQHRVRQQNRRTRKKRAGGSFSAGDIERIFAAQKGRCAMPVCQRRLSGGYHIDHVVPLALGGSNWPRNLQLLCQRCNQKKHAKDPLLYAREVGLLI